MVPERTLFQLLFLSYCGCRCIFVITKILFYIFRDDDILYVSEGENFIKHCDNVKTLAKSPAITEQNKPVVSNSEWVTLNVGGKYFTTTISTLTTKEPMSMLAR